MKKLLFFLILVALGVGIYFFFFQEKANAPEIDPNEEAVTLRVGFSEWPPDLIAYLAQEKGFFEANGLDVELIQLSGFEELFEKIEKGDVDVWSATLLDAVLAYSKGDDWQIISVEDYSNGADAVLTYESSGIEEVADLEGKTIGAERGTVGEFFLQILLERDGLSLADVNVVDMSYDAIPAALASGEIDAGVTYEPSITETLNGGGQVLVDSASERGTIVDVYSAHGSHIAEYPGAYTKFINSILDAADYYNENPEESIEIMARPYGNDLAELMESFEKLSIPDLRDNKTAFNRTSGFESLFNLAKQAELYLLDQGLITETGDLNGLLGNLIEGVKR